MPTLSVIIVTYNSADVIHACLSALLDPRLEVIVVDNASSDATVALVQQNFSQVILIDSGGNLGYGAGNNLGAQHATGTHIAIVNPDLTATADDLLAMVAYLDNHPDAGIVGPRMLHGDGTPIISARGDYTVARVLAKYFALDRVNKRWVYGDYPHTHTGDTPLDVAWLQGSCLVMRRDDFLAMGGFDDGFFLFAEDVDLCERVRAQGQRVVYLRSVTVQHLVSSSVKRAHLISTRAYHLSPLYYFGKRGHRRAVWMLKLGFSVELGIKILLRLLRGDAAGRRLHRQVLRDVWRWPRPTDISQP